MLHSKRIENGLVQSTMLPQPTPSHLEHVTADELESLTQLQGIQWSVELGDDDILLTPWIAFREQAIDILSQIERPIYFFRTESAFGLPGRARIERFGLADDVDARFIEVSRDSMTLLSCVVELDRDRLGYFYDWWASSDRGFIVASHSGQVDSDEFIVDTVAVSADSSGSFDTNYTRLLIDRCLRHDLIIRLGRHHTESTLTLQMFGLPFELMDFASSPDA